MKFIKGDIGTLNTVFPKNETDLLQEMFDRTAELLSDDLLERYIIEEGPNEGKPLPPNVAKHCWLAELFTLESLSIKLGMNFDLEKTRSNGERYLNIITPKKSGQPP